MQDYIRAKIDKYQDTINEAKRFIKKAEIAKKKMKEDRYAVFGCKETGAAKRASMDLTRSLAELRKP